jgi:hypothetical protein
LFGFTFRVTNLLSPRSSEVEHFLGKEEVIGSIPIVGSNKNSQYDFII